MNSLATGAVLVALILAFQPVAAAFNPVVTLVEQATGLIGTRQAGALIGGRVLGGIVGAVVANLMFDLPPVSVSTQVRSGSGQLLAELVATLGLMLVFATVHRSRVGRSGPSRSDERAATRSAGTSPPAYWRGFSRPW